MSRLKISAEETDSDILREAAYEIIYLRTATRQIGKMAETLRVKNDAGYGISSTDVKAIYKIAQEVLDGDDTEER